ncbi:hypothetical protein GF323_05660 [Candidatus Woesearchaeota archaeon]|nr:hypothetical protein [Candidatus Woesearchaeota archaeon]
MAKKKKNNPAFSSLQAFWKDFLQVAVKNMYDDFLATLGKYVESTERKMIHILSSFVFLIAGIIFLFISFVFLLQQYLRLTMGWSLFIPGIILILISLLISLNIKNKEVN